MAEKQKTLLIIAGMHRSGTSLLSCIFHHLGAQLGNDLIPAPEIDNKIGYWEPQPVVDLHERVFAAMNMRSDDPYLLNDKLPKQQLQNDISKWLEQFDSDLISVKDPRICRFLPQWLKAAKQMNLTAKIIIPYRNPLEVAQSLAKRGNEYQNIDMSLIWWSLHVLEAQRASRDNAYSLCYYPELLNNWQETINKISDELQINWSYKPADIAPKINKLLDISLYRNHHDINELIKIDRLGFASQIFQILESKHLDDKKLDNIYTQICKFLAPISHYNLEPHGNIQELAIWHDAITKWKNV